jgi:hypothetical protein
MSLRERVKRVWDDVMAPAFDEFAADVQVQTLDLPATTVDGLYGEAEGEKTYKAPVTVKARVKLDRSRAVLPGGESEEVDGRATFRIADLAAAGVTLDFGTLVTVGGAAYTVVRIESAGQVGNEFLLTRAWLRLPAP